jgi:hypothetical protein
MVLSYVPIYIYWFIVAYFYLIFMDFDLPGRAHIPNRREPTMISGFTCPDWKCHNFFTVPSIILDVKVQNILQNLVRYSNVIVTSLV